MRGLAVVLALGGAHASTSGFYLMPATDYNCEGVEAFSPSDLLRPCGESEKTPCALALNEATAGQHRCGAIIQLGSEFGATRTIWGQVKHLDETMHHATYGLLAGAMRELCPFVCTGDEDRCVASPSECAGAAVPPTMHTNGQIEPGSAVLGSRGFPWVCKSKCARENSFGTMPSGIMSLPAPSLAPWWIKPDRTTQCGSKRAEYSDAFDECGGPDQEECFSFSSYHFECESCRSIELFNPGIADPDNLVCKNGGCASYTTTLGVIQMDRGPDPTADVFLTQAGYAKHCPLVCQLEGGAPSGVCVKAADDCLHGAVLDRQVDVIEWGNVMYKGAMDNFATQYVIAVSNRTCERTGDAAGVGSLHASAVAAAVAVAFFFL